jgi:hypothetical protein
MKKLIAIIIMGIILISCSTSKSCHTKGVYVDKAVKKAQKGPKQ